jgi:hypothetical protein
VIDDQHRKFLEWRGIEDMCPRCHGTGQYMYGSTSTWRRGIGGATCTMGVCDNCWGSGDWYRPWTDIRQMEAEVRASKRSVRLDAFIEWLASQTGANYDLAGIATRLVFARTSELLRKEARRRTGRPEGIDEFWWQSALKRTADVLAMVGEPPHAGKDSDA